MGTSPERRRRLGPLRSGAFALVVLVGVLVGGNLLVEQLERAGVIDTHRPGERVAFADEPLYEDDGDGRWRTTRYAERTGMLRQEFRRDKGDALRVFVLGASFAMGSPYVVQGHDDRGGGIPGFLQRSLEAANPGRLIEVVSAAAGGQDSTRVRSIARQVIRLEPDVLVVATCNNEGEPPPDEMREWLHRQGGYRLLRTLLTRPRPGDGSWYTPQDPDTASTRTRFQENTRAILRAATEAGVPVVLATLPVNLRYRGFVQEPAEDVAGAERPATAIPDGFEGLPICATGVQLFDAWAFEEALPLLWGCLASGSRAGPMAELIPVYAALAESELGLADDETRRVLEASLGACIADGIELHTAGEHQRAIDVLGSCDDPAEATHWMGRSLLASGRVEEARLHLEMGVELSPRNRCRPSFNALIRDEASAAGIAELADLDAAAVGLAPDGLPGPDLFLDYCHMNWRGYAAMSRTILDALGRAVPGIRVDGPDPVELGRALGRPEGDNAEQVRVTSSWADEPTLPPGHDGGSP